MATSRAAEGDAREPGGRETLSALALSAWLLATLLHLRQIAYLAAPGNRYASHWERADGFALAATLLATAGLMLAGAALLVRVRRLRRALGPYWLWIAGNSLLTLATYWDPNRAALEAGWLANCAACAALLWRGGERVHRAALALGRALWTVSALTLAQVLWWAPWGSPLDPLDAPPETRVAGPPVYFVIFDGWSAQESLARGRFRDFTPELRALAQQSFVFERAISPSFDTAVSVPRLLFAKGEGWWLTPGNSEAVWQRSEDRYGEPLEAADVLDVPNLFQPFAQRGYATVLTGYYLPYRRLLGPELNVARSEPHVPRGSTLADRLGVRALAGMRYLQGLGAGERLLSEHRLRYSQNWFALNQRVLADTLEIAADWPRNTFSFSHFPMPHPPFVIAADGSFRGPYRGDRSSGTRADYRLHLRNLDRIVGLLVAALRENGRFDEALIVMTGDHGWKRHDRRVLHVPLLIKWPHQREARAIDGVFPTLALPALLELASRGGMGESEARNFIAEHTQPVPKEGAPPL